MHDVNKPTSLTSGIQHNKFTCDLHNIENIGTGGHENDSMAFYAISVVCKMYALQ